MIVVVLGDDGLDFESCFFCLVNGECRRISLRWPDWSRANGTPIYIGTTWIVERPFQQDVDREVHTAVRKFATVLVYQAQTK